MTSKPALVDNAVKLFTYLARLQELKERRVSDLESYKDDGKVIWFHSLPQHEAVHLDEEINEGGPLLTVARLDAAESLVPPKDVQEVLEGAWDDPDLRPSIAINASEEATATASNWLSEWDVWAETERLERPTRRLYDELFQLRRSIENASETFELILGFGLLSWRPKEHDRVRRHLFTVSVEIGFDDVSGDISVSIIDSQGHIRPELNMLDPGIYDTALPSRLQALTDNLDPVTISPEISEQIGAPAANLLAHDGAYENVVTVPEQHSYPLVTYSPALILRRKGQRGFTSAFTRIAELIGESGEVPAGLIPMVDPDQPPATAPDSKPGSIIEANEHEIFSPLPLNSEQERVLKRVDSNAQTVVQGPPGTGKTHTAAALISHLLAQGKRILVTAYTDRALYEVRSKLPKEIRDLAVSAIGTSATEMAELKGSITTIASATEKFDLADNQAREQEEQHHVSELLSAREKLSKKLVDVLQAEAATQKLGSYQGTKAELINRYSDDADTYRWILHEEGPKLTKSPLLNEEAGELLSLLRDDALASAADELSRTPNELPEFISPQEFATAAGMLRGLDSSNMETTSQEAKQLAETLPNLSRDTANQIDEQLTALIYRVSSIDSTSIDWQSHALREVIAGSTGHWVRMVENLTNLIKEARNLLDTVGAGMIKPADSLASFAPQAEKLRDFVQSGNSIALKSDGTAKIGLFSSSIIKNCSQLLTTVSINGRVPTTVEDFTTILSQVRVEDLLARAEHMASVFCPIPQGGSVHQRVAELQKTIDLLEPVLALGHDITQFSRSMHERRMPPLSWQSTEALRTYRDALRCHIHRKDLDSAREPFESLAGNLRRLGEQKDNLADWLIDLTHATESLDAAAYTRSLEAQDELEQSRPRVDRLTRLLSKLEDWHPALTASLKHNPTDPRWDNRFVVLQEAADWVRLGHRIGQRYRLDVNSVQDEIRSVDEKLYRAAGDLAQLRAWREAVYRLTPTARGRLTDYVQQTKRLGKGTGKYAAEQRAAVRRALDACRDYVPVWIMPLGKVVDQVSLRENSFDVVIVDEASQAGMEATFLQFLAPRIVVIGDDKQVSPSAIGVTYSDINHLANQFLDTLPFKDALANPERSFFDDAVMRFAGQVTLKEHRRCVPEIINFSNRIAYERENIHLEPVRQVGRERLDPFKVIYAEGGVTQGSGESQYNMVEAQAIVDLIVNCLEDSNYDGMTFGVISLTGKGQVKKIQQLLSQKVAPGVIEERDLMVGNAPDFQGAERDVMFLSMVASLNGKTRVTALTKELFVQRYNVAVSRAKDQVWVVHSLRRSDVHAEGDMRHELLEYAYDIAARTTQTLEVSLPVDEHNRVVPFDSLFEQRVYNQIAARGYSIKPQVLAIGYRIDLVVEGVDQKVAVECDGDHWHSGEVIKADMARQRNLERVGWTVFRVRESDFYADGADSLKPLWALLDDKGIQPGDLVEDMNKMPSGNYYRVNDDNVIEQLGEPGDTADSGAVVLARIESTKRRIGNVAWDSAAEEPDESSSTLEARTFTSLDDSTFHSSELDSDFSVADAVYEVEHAPLDSEDFTWDSFTPFDAILPRVQDATSDEILDGILAILHAEGPARGDQIFDSFVRAAGGRRGKIVNKTLQDALNLAKRKQLVYEDNPSHERLVLRRTFRLPDQPEVHVRSIGTRELYDVPEDEMLIVTTHFARDSHDEEEVLRRTLKFYGGRKLTTRIRDILLPTVQKAMRNFP